MADGLVERGAKGMRFQIAEEPTHMRGEAHAIISMVDQAHQRLDSVSDWNGIENADAFRELGIEEFHELGRPLLGQLDVEVFIPSDHAHRQRWTEGQLRMAAVSGRVSDRNSRATQRAVEEPDDVEVGDEANGIGLDETQPMLTCCALTAGAAAHPAPPELGLGPVRGGKRRLGRRTGRVAALSDGADADIDVHVTHRVDGLHGVRGVRGDRADRQRSQRSQSAAAG